jgi:hypothetical protein
MKWVFFTFSTTIDELNIEWDEKWTSFYHSTFRIAAILVDVAIHKTCNNMSYLNVECEPKATNMATIQNWSFKIMFCAIQFTNNFKSYQ